MPTLATLVTLGRFFPYEVFILRALKHVIEATVSNPFVSFPYLLFVDDFGIHRNMYRALKAFYLIPACLSYDERRKLANVFTITLGPHGANLDDVIESIRQPIQELDAGMNWMSTVRPIKSSHLQ